MISCLCLCSQLFTPELHCKEKREYSEGRAEGPALETGPQTRPLQRAVPQQLCRGHLSGRGWSAGHGCPHGNPRKPNRPMFSHHESVSRRTHLNGRAQSRVQSHAQSHAQSRAQSRAESHGGWPASHPGFPGLR